jgi:glucose-6-phosphate 1-dehydrogenase
LTKRLVVPALYHPVQAGKLADKFAVVGVDQDDRTTAARAVGAHGAISASHPHTANSSLKQWHHKVEAEQ